MSIDDPYSLYSNLIDEWAGERGVKVVKRYRDDWVRLISIFSKTGDLAAQVWMDVPHLNGDMDIHAAEIIDATSGKWGTRETRTVNVSNFKYLLDEVCQVAFTWAGPAAFT